MAIATQAATGRKSAAVTIRRQTPYGVPRGAVGAWPNNKGFVGGDNDQTGLVHLGAREYDPSLGRFVSPDPLQDLTDPQQWSTYAYANNSPVTKSDPTGAMYQHEDTGGWPKPPPGGVTKLPTSNEYTNNNRGGYNIVDGGTGNTASSGLSDADIQRAHELKKKKLKDVLLEHAGVVIKEASGWNDIADCAKGSFWACVSAASSLVPIGKLKNAWKTGKALYRAGKAVLAWMDDIKWADDILARLQKSRSATSCVLPRHSFAPSTKVLLPNGKTKQIKDLKVGDKVLATDPVTGRTAARAVTATHSHQDTYLTDVTVRVKGRDAVLRTTGNHPFWDETTDTWINASYLSAGASALRTVDGTLQPVTGVRNYSGNQNMRDLTVADIHTYYVLASDTAVLVHNCTPGADKPGVPGGVENLGDVQMATDDALDTAVEFLEPGYQDMGDGRFLSGDGLRQVRMTDRDTRHPTQNPHINFETYRNPIGPGRRSGRPVSNHHVFLPEEKGWHPCQICQP